MIKNDVSNDDGFWLGKLGHRTRLYETNDAELLGRNKSLLGHKVRQKLLTVIFFAVAFGFVEAAVVIYLRHLVNGFQPEMGKEEVLLLVPGVAFLEPKIAFEIIKDTAILGIERIREVATLAMLVGIAALAGKRLGEKVAFFFLAFGIWDVFYYLFLKLAIGWPARFSDLDIFFFLPTPWVGPVFVPILISTALIIGSTIYLLRKGK